MKYPVMVVTENGKEPAIRNLLARFNVHPGVETRMECGYDEVKEKMEKVCWDPTRRRRP